MKRSYYAQLKNNFMTKKQFLYTLFLFEIFFSSFSNVPSKTGVITYTMKKRKVTVLNPLQMVSQLKQFVRLCYYLRVTSQTHIQFLVDNSILLRLLTVLYTKYPIFFSYSLGTLLHRNTVTTSKMSTNCLVQFGAQHFKNDAAARRLFHQNILLSQHFLLSAETFKLDTYTTYLDYTDFKKVLFIGLLISHCFFKK